MPVVPINPVPNANAAPKQDVPPVTVTLKLDEPIIHAIAESDDSEKVLCDVQFSQNLLHRDAARDTYEVVAKDLGNHGKQLIELGANIKGTGAAIEITVTRIGKNVRCDLKPLFPCRRVILNR